MTKGNDKNLQPLFFERYYKFERNDDKILTIRKKLMPQDVIFIAKMLKSNFDPWRPVTFSLVSVAKIL